MEDELTFRQAAELLGVQHKRVAAMVRQGLLPAGRLVETPAGTYRVLPRAEVERLAAERRAYAEGRSEERRPGPKPNLPRPGDA